MKYERLLPSDTGHDAVGELQTQKSKVSILLRHKNAGNHHLPIPAPHMRRERRCAGRLNPEYFNGELAKQGRLTRRQLSRTIQGHDMSYRIPSESGIFEPPQTEGEINQGPGDDLPIPQTSCSIVEYVHWPVPIHPDHHSQIGGQEQQHGCA